MTLRWLSVLLGGLVAGCSTQSLADLQGGSGGAGASDGGAGQAGQAGQAGAAGAGGGAGSAGSGGASGAAGASGASGGHTVSGMITIVNPGAGSLTSVILAPLSFNPEVPSLSAPSGPKASNVSSAWSIPNVPDGVYRVLVAYENDGLVLAPDTSIATSTGLQISVAGADVALADSVKVTGALEVLGPPMGATSDSVVLEWTDDSNEDHYELRVTDPTGKLVWEVLDVPAASGSGSVAVPYAGPMLQTGALYQFRATAVKGGIPITRTEDLRGVFMAP